MGYDYDKPDEGDKITFRKADLGTILIILFMMALASFGTIAYIQEKYAHPLANTVCNQAFPGTVEIWHMPGEVRCQRDNPTKHSEFVNVTCCD